MVDLFPQVPKVLDYGSFVLTRYTLSGEVSPQVS